MGNDGNKNIGKSIEETMEIVKARRGRRSLLLLSPLKLSAAFPTLGLYYSMKAERSNGAMAVDKDEREKNRVVVGRREDVMDAVIAKTRKSETPVVSSL
ncbi:hypothetical protein L1887_06244 [Cichorium endivia]|nr:hypothetical protein L1887_06244 [Cichorium endivia]